MKKIIMGFCIGLLLAGCQSKTVEQKLKAEGWRKEDAIYTIDELPYSACDFITGVEMGDACRSTYAFDFNENEFVIKTEFKDLKIGEESYFNEFRIHWLDQTVERIRNFSNAEVIEEDQTKVIYDTSGETIELLHDDVYALTCTYDVTTDTYSSEQCDHKRYLADAYRYFIDLLETYDLSLEDLKHVQ